MASSQSKIRASEQKTDEIRLKALENAAKYSTSTASGISKSFAVEAQKSQMALKNFGTFGTTVFTSLKKNSVSAFEALGNGSKTAGEAMKGFLFGSIADIAQAQGELHIANGIATYNPIEFGEGGVLIALASALRSQASGSSSLSSGGGGGGGGGGASASSTDTSGAAQKPTDNALPQQKHVTLNIHGNVLNNDQTRTYITDLVREASDATDFSINKIGQA